MKKQIIAIVVIIIALGAIFYFDLIPAVTRTTETSTSTPEFNLPEFELPAVDLVPVNDSLMAAQAWTIFQTYIKFARNHDLVGLRTVAYQISETCNDPAKVADCNALMDGVVTIAGDLRLEDFKLISYDEKQVVMYTEAEKKGQPVGILHFVRANDDKGTPKVLGISVCIHNPDATEQCVETDPNKRDRNNNGWWDSVEALFY